MSDQRGLHRKYEVFRTDYSDLLGEKHHGCDYFVLDMTHDDPAAVIAVLAYADAVEQTRPQLAYDLRAKYGTQGGEQ